LQPASMGISVAERGSELREDDLAWE
jgi:hypothetical protein